MKGAVRTALLALAVALATAAPASAATLSVTSGADSGPGSLRDAVAAAAAGDVVVIAPGVNPTLSSGEIAVNGNITIRGQGAKSTTVSAGGTSRIVRIAGATVAIEDLLLKDGRAPNGHDGTTGTSGGAGEDGGAVLNQAGSNLVLRRVAITGGRAGNGGNGGDALLLNPGNGGAGGRGGAVASFGSLTIEASTLVDNRAGNGGQPGSGGILGSASGGAGGGGGAIFVNGAAGRTTLLENVTLTRNVAGNGAAGAAAGDGGGVYSDGGGANGSIVVRHGTVVGNSAGSAGAGPGGGGVASAASAGTFVVQNSILAGNTGPDGPNCGAGVADGGNNVAFPRAGCPGGFADGNPQLHPDGLADNGGPTQTVAIVGAGSALNKVPAGSNCSAADQRGVFRPQGPACDAGAFEHKAPTCNDRQATTKLGKTITIKLSCAGPGSIKYAKASDPARGEVVGVDSNAGTVRYRADRRFRGEDTFTYVGTNLVGQSAPAAVKVTIGGPPPPPNNIRFGKPRLNRNKGTAKLPVRVPGKGRLKVTGKGVRNVSKKVKKKGRVTVPIRPTKKAHRRLKRRGVATVTAKVRFTPKGGFPKNRSKEIRLRVNSFFVPI